MSPFSSGSHHQWAYNQSHYVFSLINIPNHSFSFCTHDLPLPALVSVTQGLSSGLMTSASRLFHLRGPFGRHLTWSSSSSLELRTIEKDLGGGLQKRKHFQPNWATPGTPFKVKHSCSRLCWEKSSSYPIPSLFRWEKWGPSRWGELA